MDGIKKCLDTYALVEIKLGNPKFKYLSKSLFVITDLTLAEFYSVIIREENEQTAEYWFKKFEPSSLPVDKEILKESVKFRQKHKKARISFFDAVGYIFSLKKGYKFVTGDEEFKKLDNVEFRKK